MNEPRQCEMCDEFFEHEPVMGGRRGLSAFCSVECKQDADDDIHMWDVEDRYDAITGENGPPDSDRYDVDRPEF